jgi:hypothetical protein
LSSPFSTTKPSKKVIEIIIVFFFFFSNVKKKAMVSSSSQVGKKEKKHRKNKNAKKKKSLPFFSRFYIWDEVLLLPFPLHVRSTLSSPLSSSLVSHISSKAKELC